MEQPIIRLHSLEIKYIKNVSYGRIEFSSAPGQPPDHERAQILGIYGQNGSGKTAMVDACYFLQYIMSGKSLDQNFGDYISQTSNFAQIIARYFVISEDAPLLIEYLVRIQRLNSNEVIIARELLRSETKVYIDYCAGSSEPPEELKNYPDQLSLILNQKMAERTRSSFIFGSNSRDLYSATDFIKAFPDYTMLQKSLYHFSRHNLFVIRNSHSGVISANLMLPMAFRSNDSSTGVKGDFTIPLNDAVILSRQRVNLLTTIISEINAVLFTIIPGLQIGIKSYGAQLTDSGDEGEKVELTSVRDDITIPIRMESAGIIKLISILNAIIQAFADASVCLVIDELDSGIFEYLLGELLDIIQKHAKGQLIFTSHNLRPLEMLRPESIVFSTANADNRYIHLLNSTTNQNLRDVYIRSITLGGQPEEIYMDADSLKIARAFRKAGRNAESEQ